MLKNLLLAAILLLPLAGCTICTCRTCKLCIAL